MPREATRTDGAAALLAAALLRSCASISSAARPKRPTRSEDMYLRLQTTFTHSGASVEGASRTTRYTAGWPYSISHTAPMLSRTVHFVLVCGVCVGRALSHASSALSMLGPPHAVQARPSSAARARFGSRSGVLCTLEVSDGGGRVGGGVVSRAVVDGSGGGGMSAVAGAVCGGGGCGGMMCRILVCVGSLKAAGRCRVRSRGKVVIRLNLVSASDAE